jgi:predicted GNAT family N-acyltransferase
MHAQVHLQQFYEAFGFRREGGIFEECGIDHITMLREGE